jgi:hypothetical protein
MSRPSKYEEKYNEQVYKLCLLGATDVQIADFLDISESTFNEWKKLYPMLSESIKKGKEIADATVAEKLYHRAIGYEHPETITASFQGEITDMKTVTKHYAPDPTAAIFWLKNRQSKKWRDKHEIQQDGTIVSIEVEADDSIREKLAEKLMGWKEKG